MFLAWMFHGRQTSNKINKLHERALIIVYDDTAMPFADLFIKDRSFIIYQQNLYYLAIEIYMALNNLPGGNFSEFFTRASHTNILRSNSELILLSINTLAKEKHSIN